MIRRTITIGPYFLWRKMQFIPSHDISFLEAGKGDNVVLCVHGLTRNAHDFERLSFALKKDFRVISVDMPGRGGSEYLLNKAHYNYNLYIKDILLFLKELSIPNVHFVGSSMGGLIGMALATYYPKVIKSLVINDVGPELPNKTLVRIEKYVGLNPAFDNFEEAKKHSKIIFKNFGLKEESEWDHITENSFTLGKDGKYRLSYDPNLTSKAPRTKRAEGMVDLWHLWNKIKCPTLLIHGTKSDILLQSTIDKMKIKRNFDLHKIEDAGHIPALVYKEDIKFIESWLRKHSS